MTNEEFLKDVCPNHTEKSKWNKNELLHILDLHKEQLWLHIARHGMELLPDFLYKNSFGATVIGYHGDTEVTEEWQSYLKKLSSCE